MLIRNQQQRTQVIGIFFLFFCLSGHLVFCFSFQFWGFMDFVLCVLLRFFLIILLLFSGFLKRDRKKKDEVGWVCVCVCVLKVSCVPTEGKYHLWLLSTMNYIFIWLYVLIIKSYKYKINLSDFKTAILFLLH